MSCAGQQDGPVVSRVLNRPGCCDTIARIEAEIWHYTVGARWNLVRFGVYILVASYIMRGEAELWCFVGLGNDLPVQY